MTTTATRPVGNPLTRTTPVPAPREARAVRLGDVGLALRQVRFEQRSFWRNRSRALFTVALPLMFLVVFEAMNGSHRIKELGGIRYGTWFVPGILAYGLITATYANVAISTAIARDTGVMKRMRGTAMPTWAYLAGRIGATLVTAAVLCAATLGLGVTAYGVTVRTATLPGLLATLALGTMCFTVLGLALASVIPNADAAPAVANLTVLPLTFISGIWMVLDGAPRWLTTVAKVFPVRGLAHGLQHAFDPRTRGSGLVAQDLLVLAAWFTFGLAVCVRSFRRASVR